MTQKDKSSFSKKIGEKELSTLSDITLTNSDIRDVLIAQGHLNPAIVKFLASTKEELGKFQFSSESMKYLIDELGKFTGYKVYLTGEHLYKLTLKTYMDNVEANTWLKSKSEINDEVGKVKTDSFVENETTSRTANIKLIHSFINDFNREIESVISSIDSVISFINVKIKYLREERYEANNQERTVKKTQ